MNDLFTSITWVVVGSSFLMLLHPPSVGFEQFWPGLLGICELPSHGLHVIVLFELSWTDRICAP